MYWRRALVNIDELRDAGYLVSPKAISGRSEREQAEFMEYLKHQFFTPGSKVRVSQEDVANALSVAEPGSERMNVLLSLQNAGNKEFEVDCVYYNDTYDAGYRLKNSDILIYGRFITDARPTKHFYGVVYFHDERLFVVEFDVKAELDKAEIIGTYEILNGVEQQFLHAYGATSIPDLKAAFIESNNEGNPAISGEMTIADNGGALGEIWSLSVLSWGSGVSPRELKKTREAVENYLSAAPGLN